MIAISEMREAGELTRIIECFTSNSIEIWTEKEKIFANTAFDALEVISVDLESQRGSLLSSKPTVNDREALKMELRRLRCRSVELDTKISLISAAIFKEKRLTATESYQLKHLRRLIAREKKKLDCEEKHDSNDHMRSLEFYPVWSTGNLPDAEVDNPQSNEAPISDTQRYLKEREYYTRRLKQRIRALKTIGTPVTSEDDIDSLKYRIASIFRDHVYSYFGATDPEPSDTCALVPEQITRARSSIDQGSYFWEIDQAKKMDMRRFVQIFLTDSRILDVLKESRHR